MANIEAMLNQEPISKVRWVKRETLHANNFNPNRVAPPEMKLIKVSILEDGWSQPITITADNEIIDGFHRWTVSDDKEMRAVYDGYVPVTTLKPKDAARMKMSTIRMNRARGTHGVMAMSEIVKSMLEDGLDIETIMKELQMEREEVTRLSVRAGIPMSDKIQGKGFGKAWIPKTRPGE